jgi:nitrite reductase/ring-hydroxylating ferredoxin subunit
MPLRDGPPGLPSSAATSSLERRDLLRLVVGCAAGAFCGTAIGAEGLAVLGLTTPPATQGNERRYPIPTVDGVTVDQPSAVMLTRYQGKVFALALACPHQRAAVRWLPTEQRFKCSKHDSKYQPSGTYTSGRATRNLDRFPIRRDGDQVIVDVTKVFKSDEDASGWANAAVAV